MNESKITNGAKITMQIIWGTKTLNKRFRIHGINKQS